jgi:FkbM family methyltransferase
MKTIPPVRQQKAVTQVELKDWIGRKARTIVEIGAHEGGDTHFFAEAFPEAQIYAFEPDARALEIFKGRGSHPRIHLIEAAIGAHDGVADFHVSGGLMPNASEGQKQRYAQGWSKSGSLRAPKNHLVDTPWVTFERTVPVQVMRLDTWAAAQGIEKIDFIWADVQGAEADMIAGGQKILASTRYLYTEYCDNELYEGQATLAQIVDLLPDFVIQARFPSDVMLRNDRIEPPPRLDRLIRFGKGFTA